MVWQWACFNHTIFWGVFILFMLWIVYNRIISHKDIFIFYLAKQSVNFKSLTFCSNVLALCLFFTHEKNRVNHERKLYLLGFCWQCKGLWVVGAHVVFVQGWWALSAEVKSWSCGRVSCHYFSLVSSKSKAPTWSWSRCPTMPWVQMRYILTCHWPQVCIKVQILIGPNGMTHAAFLINTQQRVTFSLY